MKIDQRIKVSPPLLTEFDCWIDNNGHPIIHYKEKKHTSLSSLLKEASWLLEEKHLKTLASIANFFFKGIEFNYIEDIENFKKVYQQQIEQPKLGQTSLPFQVTDFGKFDVSSMCEPYLHHDTFIFYVKNHYNQLPYRVSCSYPPVQEDPKVSYELLPRLA